MKPLLRNSLYSFHLLTKKHPLLFFDWTDRTKEMNYEDFQAACNNFAGFAWEYQAKHLVVNTCHFHFSLPNNFAIWREQQLNPRYYKLGVEKFAYVTRPEFLIFSQDIPAEKGKFETRNFVANEDAIHWLTS